MKKNIAIISTVYENYDVLKDFMASLEKQKNGNFHLFLSDQSTNKKPIVSHGLPITVIPSYNAGYAHGINLGLKAAIQDNLETYCIMNNDTYFKDDFIENVTNSSNNHPSSIIGGKIYYAPGYEYHKDRYAKKDLGNILWYAGGKFDWNHALTPHRGVDEVDNKQYDNLEETDFVNGCLMCFDKNVLDTVGFWDESYFLYFEDADYCVRAQKKGMNLYYDPSIIIWHKNAQSTGGSGSKTHVQYQEKNRLLFGLKYAPWKTKLHLIKNFVFDRFK